MASSTSPRRLSERRGIMELSPLDSGLMFKRDSTASSMTAYIERFPQPPPSYESSVSDTHASNTPFTSPETSPLRALAPPLEMASSILGSTIKEEDVDSDCCDCVECEAQRKESLEELAPAMSHFDGAFMDSPTMRSEEFARQYMNNEKLAPVSMPPTPPSHAGERPYNFGSRSHIRNKRSQDSAIDADAFSSNPPSLPQSPSAEPTFGKSRAALILNKVVPAKLRAAYKRRISGPNTPAAPLETPPVPPLPCTPPDIDSFFFTATTRRSSSENTSAFPSPTQDAILPPLLQSMAERESDVAASQQPHGLAITGADFSGATTASVFGSSSVSSALPAVFASPKSSPAVSVSSSAPGFISHRKVPSIDPGTPVAPSRPMMSPELVTADSLADMIEDALNEKCAYDATLERMVASGWSSPQEIRNVEMQRSESQRCWQERIRDAKKVLESSRTRVLESVSSMESLGSPVATPPMRIGSQRSRTGSARTMSR